MKLPMGWGIFCCAQQFSRESIRLTTMEQHVARYAVSLIPRLIPLEGFLTIRESKTGGLKSYQVNVDTPADRGQLIDYFAEQFPQTTFDRLGGEEGVSAFLCGAFLACGSFTDPNRSYHLEFAPPRREAADLLLPMLQEVGFQPKVTERRGLPLIYFRDSGQMEDLFTFLGVPRFSLELMEIKILKDRRNAANRASNCDSANIDKVIGAALSQLEDIRLLTQEGGLEALPEEVRATARMRLELPEVSLRELSEKLGLSRSAVNRRLKKIAELADACRKEKEQEGEAHAAQ
jgi:hypothetical protein